jgi:phosphate transport system substrate-binding protein
MKSGIITIAFALLVNVGFAQKLKGSDTVLPLAQKEAEVYMKKNNGARVTVIGGGSGVGIAALMDGTTEIAMSSRKMKMGEKIKLQDAGKASKETMVAYDALTVIVHPSNKIAQLTREQISDIYTGKIKNWKEVGGDDLQIIVYARESSSGTYEFFKEFVMGNKNYAASSLSMPASGSIVQSVSQTKGAIGYVGMAYIEKEIKALKVSYDKGKTFIAPSLATAKDKSYPIIRPLFFYYLTTSEKVVKPFIDFMLSAEGQKIVEEVGYVPMPKN